MNSGGRSPSNNFYNPRFSSGTPSRTHQFNARTPLYLQPNSPCMSPRGNRMSSPRQNLSPDFIPLGISSPLSRAKQRWSNQNYSSNSSYSSFGSSPNSSQNNSPYNRHGYRGNFRGRGRKSNSSNSGVNSPPISCYVDKECLQDPWADLERNMPKCGSPNMQPTEGGTDRNSSDSDSGSSVSNDADDS